MKNYKLYDALEYLMAEFKDTHTTKNYWGLPNRARLKRLRLEIAEILKKLERE